MELSRITVTSAFDGAETLYHIGGKEENNTLILRAGETADFRTFFSSLDARFLLEKTTVRYLTLRLFFDGKATVKLYRAMPTEKKAKKGRKKYTEYLVAEKTGSGEIRISADVFGGGSLGATVTAEEDTVVYGGDWTCPAECVLRSPRIGVIALGETKQAADELSSDSVRFYDVVDAEGDNGNVARRMTDCINNGDTHFLILRGAFDPNVIRRTAALISVLSHKYELSGICGARMYPSAPTVIAENGRIFGKKILNPKKDTPTDVGGLLWCVSEDEEADYGGWHYYCAPVSVLPQTVLPLPIGTVFSDAEFGMRLNAYGTLFATGLGVWSDEKIDDYTAARNEAIVRGLVSPKTSGRRNRARLRSAYFKYIRDRKRLNDVMDGLTDYLKGPEALGKRESRNRGFFGATAKAIGLWFRLFRSGRANRKYEKKFDELTGAESYLRNDEAGEE